MIRHLLTIVLIRSISKSLDLQFSPEGDRVLHLLYQELRYQLTPPEKGKRK